MERLKKVFGSAREFNEKFPRIDRGNGTFQHAENIFIQQLKHRPFLEWIDAIGPNDELVRHPTTAGLVARVYSWLKVNGNNNQHRCKINGIIDAHSPAYEILDGGVCEDGDIKCVRVYNHETSRIAKIKAGKLMHHLLTNQHFSKYLSDALINYMCEDFAQKFISSMMELNGEGLTLKYGDSYEDFEKIYDSDKQRGDFGSCMNNKDYAPYFYAKCVDATAAWLENSAGTIVARCVVFNEVHIKGENRTLRLAERQYADNGDTKMMRILINKLIEANLIDGYKKIGASCHVPHDFVLNDESAFRKDTWIQAQDVDFDYCPYMDSWKYMDEDYRMWNNDDCDYCYTFECTDGQVEESERNYDEWLDEYGREELVRAHDRRGNEIWVFDSTRENEFIYCDREDEYYPEDCVATCPECGLTFFTRENPYFSELTDDDYCCESCMLEAEKTYREEHNLVEAE